MVKYFLNGDYKTEVYMYDKVYVIVGRARNRYHDINRCIQCDFNSSKPYINTYMGYRSDKVVVFTTKTQAQNFLSNFSKSKRRRIQYIIDWEIIEYKPSRHKSCDIDYKLVEKFDDDYGYFYTLSVIDWRRIPREVEINSTCDNINEHTTNNTLETKLAELDNLVLDVRGLLENAKKVSSPQEAIDEIKDLIMKYDIRVDEVYEDDEIIDYVQNNFLPEDLIDSFHDYYWR